MEISSALVELQGTSWLLVSWGRGPIVSFSLGIFKNNLLPRIVFGGCQSTRDDAEDWRPLCIIPLPLARPPPPLAIRATVGSSIVLSQGRARYSSQDAEKKQFPDLQNKIQFSG